MILGRLPDTRGPRHSCGLSTIFCGPLDRVVFECDVCGKLWLSAERTTDNGMKYALWYRVWFKRRFIRKHNLKPPTALDTM